MKIRLLTARGGYPCGAEPDVPDDVARTWIGVGDAEPVQTSAQGEGPAPAPAADGGAASSLSAAAPGVVETAMKKKARGR